MATYYVDSSATGSNNGSSKANAFTSFYTAVSSTASGDILLVSHTHSENAPPDRDWETVAELST